MFYHVLDIRKVVEGGPWTFENSLLVYRPVMENEDPHMLSLEEMDIRVQVYDLPKGGVSGSVLKNIGNFVGKFV